jgi:hypothetical protein|tara:strand:+ start:1537 stop:2157 length:621 start_codon:yes stop_codon:yes gene_type:complete
VTGFESYQLYVSLKQHFNYSNTYNYVKYKGRSCKITSKAYESRSDKYFFESLGERNKGDLLQYYVANFAHYGSDVIWIGDLHSKESEDVYVHWQRRVQSLSYIFEKDLKEINEFLIARGLGFDRLFDVEEDEHPIIFRFVQQRMIEVETYIIMDKILGFSKRIAKDIKDSYIFPSEQYRYNRYSEFLNLDTGKYTRLMKGVFDATT